MKRRVTYTAWGMVLLGGLSAIVAVLSAGGNLATSTGKQAARPTPTPTATRQTPSPTASATPTSPATIPPSPASQEVDLFGSISSIDQASNAFVLVRSGTTTTIHVTTTTQYSGTATSLAQIQPQWRAEVHGRRSGQVVIATEVNANPNVDN